MDNLVLLCPNCHALVHRLSSEGFSGKDAPSLLADRYERQEIKRIIELSRTIKNIRQRVKQSGNIWNDDNPYSQRPYSVEEAIASVAQGNKYTDKKVRQLQEVFLLALSHIPQDLKSGCSYRLLGRGRYISINLMNYLLYRSPGYGDFGRKPTYDCFLIFTNDMRNHFEAFDERNVFAFSYFDCVNLGLSFEEVLALSNIQWEDFSRACRMAAEARKSRSWPSNILVSL